MPRASDFGGWHSSAYSPESEVGGLNQPRRSSSHVGQSPGEATRSPNERSHTAKQSYCRPRQSTGGTDESCPSPAIPSRNLARQTASRAVHSLCVETDSEERNPGAPMLPFPRFHTLEPVLVAASTDEARKAMCAVFFELCKNAVVTTNGHVLHAMKIDSSDRGDFLVPRKAIELVEIIRKATKTPEVAVAFQENHAVFRIATFDVSARLETAKFPAWEELVPMKPKHELRVSKTDLLE